MAEPLSTDDSPDLGTTQSKFHFHSIGTVAANKKATQMTIEVVLNEHFSYIDGEVTDHKKEVKSKGKDYSGEQWEVKMDTTPTVMAHWLPLGNSSRQTSPDVRRGEQVLIFRYADTDMYWWMEMMQYKHIRRLETQIWAISNNSKEDIEDDPDSTYWFEWSTHRKVIRLHTAKNDEEPFKYDIEINTKEGRIIIQDDDDNYIFLDSAERRIKAHNKDDSFVDIDKKKIWINAPEEIKLTTKHYKCYATETMDTKTKEYTEDNHNYTMTTKDDYTLTNNNYKDTTKKNHDTKVTEDATFKSRDWTHDVDRDAKVEIKRDSSLIIRRDSRVEVRRDFSHLTRRDHVWNVGESQFNGSIKVTNTITGSTYRGGHHK